MGIAALHPSYGLTGIAKKTPSPWEGRQNATPYLLGFEPLISWAYWLLIVAVVFGVMAARLGMVFFSVAGMAVGGVGVVRRFLMIAGFVMLGSFTVMLRGVLVVFGSLVMMLDACMVAHGVSPGWWLKSARSTQGI
jgi:hypothetical protein